METVIVLLEFIGMICAGGQWDAPIGWFGNIAGVGLMLIGLYIAHKEGLVV